jgi:hypothetical protein
MASALAVHYFPGMWAWNRSIVDPLVVAAYEREGGPAEGRRLLEAFRTWSARVDRFTPVRVEADVEVPVPDPQRPGDDLSTTAGQRVLYQDRIRLVPRRRPGRGGAGSATIGSSTTSPIRMSWPSTSGC